MPLIYSLVARGTAVLAEFSSFSGNFRQVVSVLLKQIEPNDAKMSYVYDEYTFHYVVAGGLTYLCMADKEFGRMIPFKFLDDIKSRFVSTYGERGLTARAYEFDADFQKVMKHQMEVHNSRTGDKVHEVREQIAQVKEVMIDNIDKVLQRGDRIELLVDKTEKLDQQAFQFKKRAKKLKNVMWWQNVKLWLLIFFIAALILYVLLAIVCGGPDLPC